MSISHGHQPYKYNEFVAPVDADFLIKAVELKQNLYDQGRASIQANMDRLSSFDIIRDQDRQYANQELDKIYKTIQTNASADFSNPQTVRSFLDISRPLEQDRTFQNAQISTAEYRKRQATLDDILKNHPDKYHAANAREYLRDTDKWLSDPNPGATLAPKQYTPYIDISKKVMDIVKQMKPNSSVSMQDVGRWINKTEVLSLDEQRIKNGVMSQLSEDEINQMRIDASFSSENTDPRTKYNTVASALTEKIRNNESFARIKGVENQTGYTQQEHAMIAKAAREELNKINDPETLDHAYANAYISNFVNGIGQTYAYQNFSNTITADPYDLSFQNSMNSLNVWKQEEDIRQKNTLEQINLRGSYDLTEAGMKAKTNGIVTPQVVSDQLKFFGVEDTSHDIAGIPHTIDFQDTGEVTSGKLNANSTVKNILDHVIKTNPSEDLSHWYDSNATDSNGNPVPNSDINSNVQLRYIPNGKGGITWEIATSWEEDNKIKTKAIKIPAVDIEKYIPDTSGGDDGTIFDVNLTGDQLSIYNSLLGK